jgi:hypothetical protein
MPSSSDPSHRKKIPRPFEQLGDDGDFEVGKGGFDSSRFGW